MNRGRVTFCFAAWLAGGLAVVCALSSPADAQSGGTPVRIAQQPFTTTVRPATRPEPAPNPLLEPSPTATTQPAPDAETIDTLTADPDADRQTRPSFGRRIVVDGDPNWPPEPAPLRDGIIDTEEPQPAVDGVDPSIVDARTQEEIAVFERPAAGHDPDAFSIELEPILDRRPSRLFRFEPFDPVGIRVGSFTLFPEAEFAGAAFSNLFRSATNVRRDVSLEVRPTVRMLSNWRTHALEFRATGLTSFHADFPTEDDRAYTLESRGRLDITRRTNIEAAASFERSQEARGSINATGAGAERNEVETRRAGLTFNHRFNRLAVQIRGTVSEIDFAPSTDNTGLAVTNNDRDVLQKEAAVRATWTFKPELGTFGEVAVNSRTYDAASSDGIERDSIGERYRVGVTFGSTSRRLRGEASIGYGRQQFEDSRLPEIRGIIIDANLAWRVSGLTSVLLTARSDVGESTLAGSGGALSRSAGVEVRHAFRRHLIGTAGLRLTHQDYEGADLQEREIAATLGLEYYVNREVTLFGRYQHLEFDSTNAGRDYGADEVRVGVRIRR